ncbi:XRE family transcriptional regulator [soil metagenome]
MGDVGEAMQIGPRVRQIRNDRGLTLVDLAGRSGVSRAMLSKVERGERQPTLVTAVRIARGLDVTLSQLMEAERQQAVVHIPASQRRIMIDPQTGLERQHLFPTVPSSRLEFVRAILPPGGSTGDFEPHAAGVEQYMVVEQGRLRATLDGTERIVENGDALYFSADRRHRFDNAGNGACSYYVVLSFPGEMPGSD